MTKMKTLIAAAPAIALTFVTAGAPQATTWGVEHDAFVKQIVESSLKHEHPAWPIDEAAYIEELVSAAYAPDNSELSCFVLSSSNVSEEAFNDLVTQPPDTKM